MKSPVISDVDLRSCLHIQKETRSGQYICDCPFCGKESHFYINKTTQLFDCKKCFVSGSVYKLLKHLDKLYLLGDKTIENIEEIKSIRGIAESEENVEESLPELPEIKMPIGFRVTTDKYLSSRGLSIKDCKRYNIGKTNVLFKYRDYALFPVYDNEKIRGYLGRYENKKVPKDKLRYKNSLNTDFASLLYGFDEIIKGKTETVIIVEGVFDKISCDKKLRLYDDDLVKCVCTFGKKISDVQIRKLMSKEITNIILSWDFDALKEIKQYGIELDRYFCTGVAVSYNKKDIDECTIEEVVDIFSNVKPIEEFNEGTIGKLKR